MKMIMITSSSSSDNCKTTRMHHKKQQLIAPILNASTDKLIEYSADLQVANKLKGIEQI